MDRIRVLANQINTVEPLILQTALPFGKVKVQLNNARRKNAINTSMQRTLQSILKNPENEILIFKGDDKGVFGCGGDVKDLFSYIQAEDKTDLYTYFLTEISSNYSMYLLNSEPTEKYGSIAVYDGYTIGEAFLLTCYSRIKICTERTILSMPECRNGLAIYLPQYFAHMKRNVGVYLWMTGEQILGKDCVAYGAADYYVHSSEIPNLMKELEGAHGFAECRKICAKYGNKDTSVSALAEAKLQSIEKTFKMDLDFASFWERLLSHAENSSDSILASHCSAWRNAMNISSRIALVFNYWLLRRSLESYDNIEFTQLQIRSAINMNSMYSDSKHGLTRAVLDKNYKPTWNHASIFDVKEEEIKRITETVNPAEPMIQTFLQKCHEDLYWLPK